MRKQHLLYIGFITPVVFWLIIFICGFILGDYNHFSKMISELGAIGTKSQYVFSTGLIVCSILSIAFVVGLYKSCNALGISVIPVLIILSYSVSIAGAAIFPLPLRLHLFMGMPSILLIFSPLLGLFLWGKKSQLPMINQMSILSFLVMSLGFLAFIPDLFGSYPGLKQRFFHVGWSVWFFYLSYGFLRLLKKGKRII